MYVCVLHTVQVLANCAQKACHAKEHIPEIKSVLVVLFILCSLQITSKCRGSACKPNMHYKGLAYISAHTRTHKHTHSHTHIHTHAYTDTPPQKQAYTHTCTHTHQLE